MQILTFVSDGWNDYNHLIRKMTVLLEDIARDHPDERSIVFVHTAQNSGENMVTEYIGKIRSFMKQKGYSVDERVFYYKKFTDLDIINKGADMAIVFDTNGCQRTSRVSKILEISGIPTTIVRG